MIPLHIVVAFNGNTNGIHHHNDAGIRIINFKLTSPHILYNFLARLQLRILLQLPLDGSRYGLWLCSGSIALHNRAVTANEEFLWVVRQQQFLGIAGSSLP